MFIRASRSQGRTYLRLVEGYRDEQGRTRQRQIAQLGRADQLTEDKVRSLIRGLRRHTGMPEIDAEAVGFEPARSLGPTWLLTEIWRELGFEEQLRRLFRSSYREFDLEAVIRVLVFNRLCDPQSKLGVLRWLERVHLPGVAVGGLHHEQLLRAMDALIGQREAVERMTASLLRPLLDQELSVVFYDITTVPIHGEHHVAGDLRQRGLSKDTHGIHRQFALGVIQTAEGLPIAHEVFEGNVAETKTLAPMITQLLERFRLERVVVVADRGLLSLDNVDTLEALGREQGLAVDYI
uniref:IS1634 family transposase n=1 Tax=Arhodomonas sp. AD133 TaxID=3415009 RepID=UPI003EBC66B3